MSVHVTAKGWCDIGGRLLAPGEDAEVEAETEQLKELRRLRLLTIHAPKPEPAPAKAPPRRADGDDPRQEQ